MRRSKAGPESQARAETRGNFTPPSYNTAPPGRSSGTLQASTPAGGGGRGGKGSRLSVRNWRVATRLNAILLLPVLVALVLGGFRVNDSMQTWREAEEAQRTAALVQAASEYGNALINERDRTAQPLLKGDRNAPEIDDLRDTTDQAARDFHRAVDNMPDKPGLKRRLAAFEKHEPKLSRIRQAAYTSSLSGTDTEEGYTTIQHPLMEFANELGLGTGNVTSYGRTVYAISLAKAAGSLTRSIGTHLLVKPGPSAADKKQQLTAFASYAYLENIALGEYTSGGRPEDMELLKSETAKAERNGKKKIAEARQEARSKGVPFVTPPDRKKMIAAIGTGAGAGKLRSQGITTDTWFQTASSTFEVYEKIEHRLSVEAVEETSQIASDAKRDAIANSAFVLLALLLAFVIAGKMARSMSHQMRSLRTAAFDVAEQRLPTLVDQLSRTDPGSVDTRVEPMPIDSRDEIGEVARAFDQVHREAVRLAAEQALLRGNVNAIFTNLSRRNQGLIERQLNLITDMEDNEADPDQLESLFRVDHLATRMRRNGENLLVLAGEEPGRRWTEPVPLVDILRAASSEVEHYERIELSGIPETEIHGQVVNDLVHLLAELLENATSFSSPQTKVRVTATRLPDGRVMVEIHDKGIGLTAEDFADINHKLANPPNVDVAVSQRMGLFVVGRLADRHGIRAQLRPSGEQTGTTSLVMLPDAITHGGGGEQPGADEDFTVSRIMAERTVEPDYGRAGRPAGELGYDDGRYEVPADPSSLDPVSRSLFREERRAALEEHDHDPAVTGEQPYGQQPGLPQGGAQAGGPAQLVGTQDGMGPGGQQGMPPGYGDPSGMQSLQLPQQQPEQAQFGDEQPQQPGGGYQHGQLIPPQDPLFQGEYGLGGPEAEPAPSASGTLGDRVGFEHQGPLPSTYRSTTEAGLPRRETGRRPGIGGQSGHGAQQPAQDSSVPPQQSQYETQQSEAGADWRTPNDDRWNKAGQLRAPQVGGVTDSGLPRRVPRANLVEGTAEQSPQEGPSVSRAPEDVRGRLSNLHRGVRRGRTAGDANQNDRQGFGPGSTYDQER